MCEWFTENFRFLMKINKKTFYVMEKDTKISRSIIYDYHLGVKRIKIINLVIIANYFNVTVDELLNQNLAHSNYYLVRKTEKQSP